MNAIDFAFDKPRSLQSVQNIYVAEKLKRCSMMFFTAMFFICNLQFCSELSIVWEVTSST